MANFFAELKRRHIYRVAAAYAVVAWVLLQIVNNIIPLMQAPVWTGQFCLLLLALGFPIAVFFAWMRELSTSDTAAAVRTSVMDGALIGVLVIVIALISYQQFAAAPSRSSSLEAAREAAARPAGISIAVLPLTNMSGDASQDFFSDGMTEEITAALAKVPDLRVVARTSAFQFKAQNRDIQSIGQQLHASHFIEGSVRKAGERVRITVQLIKADDGTHLWSENYDRELTDIFAIQEDIARAITASLRMPLGLKPGENLVNNRTKDQASYDDYLRARSLLRNRGFQSANAAVKLLEQSVARDPDFAPAWGLLGKAYRYIPRFDPVRLSGAFEQARPTAETFLAKAETAAQRAIKLDPSNSDGYSALGDIQKGQQKFLLAADLFARALALDPSNPDILTEIGTMLAATGHLKEALSIQDRARNLEPFVPVFTGNYATMLSASGETDAAIAVLDSLPRRGGAQVQRAIISAIQGRYGEAADILQLLGAPPNDAVLADQFANAVRLLRTAPTAVTSPNTLPQLGLGSWVYLYVGAPDRALEYYEGNAKISYHGGMEITPVWGPMYASIRKTERFKAYVRAAGMVDYWRAKGWPDRCRPTTGDDFVCE